MHIASSTENLTTSDGRRPGWPAQLDAVGEPACIIQIRLTKQIRRNKLKSKASSRGQGRQEFALYRRARGYGRNTSCKRRIAVVGEPACIIQNRLTKQIRRNTSKIKASSRGQGRQEFALYRRTKGYGRNTSCKRRLAAVGEPACIIQIRLTRQIRRNKRKIEASSRGQGRQEFALYERARGYGRNTSCKRRLAVTVFAREACARRGKILAGNIPPRCCCLCEE